MLFHVPMLACARYYVILYCIILEIFNISAMHMRDSVEWRVCLSVGRMSHVTEIVPFSPLGSPGLFLTPNFTP